MHLLPGRPAVLIALAIPVALAACGGAPKLDGAVYGAQIPVYPNAKLRDVGGGTYSDEIGGAVTFESKSWFFAIDDAPKVIAFYQEKLPNVPHEEDEDGGTTFKLTPVGADSGEDVSVTVRKEELQITEVVKPGKRKH